MHDAKLESLFSEDHAVRANLLTDPDGEAERPAPVIAIGHPHERDPAVAVSRLKGENLGGHVDVRPRPRRGHGALKS